MLLHLFSSTFKAEVSSVDLVESGQGRLEARIVVRRHLVRLKIYFDQHRNYSDSVNPRHLIRLQMF